MNMRMAWTGMMVGSVMGVMLFPRGGAAAELPTLKTFVQGNNLFAIDLYAELTSQPENLFFCPHSIRAVLLMTYAGAQGNTSQQMADALHFSGNPLHLHQTTQAWARQIAGVSGDASGDRLYLANALWGQQGYEFLQAFRDLMRTYYGAGLQEVDFAKAVEQARITINTWVANQTQNKIPEFFAPQALQAATTLVVTNAVYFKGAWLFPFSKDKTTEQPFTLLTGDQVAVSMMSQTASLPYSEDEEVQIVELPYVSQRLALVLVLPRQRNGLPELEARLSNEYLTRQITRLRPQKIAVSLPRLNIATQLSLPDALKNMGMTDAFMLPPANFAGMTGKQDLFISDVLHQTVLEVNEEGVEATAATAVTMSRGFAQYPVVQADHPFLFVIRDTHTNGIIFLGRVMNPSS